MVAGQLREASAAAARRGVNGQHGFAHGRRRVRAECQLVGGGRIRRKAEPDAADVLGPAGGGRRVALGCGQRRVGDGCPIRKRTAAGDAFGAGTRVVGRSDRLRNAQLHGGQTAQGRGDRRHPDDDEVGNDRVQRGGNRGLTVALIIVAGEWQKRPSASTGRSVDRHHGVEHGRLRVATDRDRIEVGGGRGKLVPDAARHADAPAGRGRRIVGGGGVFDIDDRGVKRKHRGGGDDFRARARIVGRREGEGGSGQRQNQAGHAQAHARVQQSGKHSHLSPVQGAVTASMIAWVPSISSCASVGSVALNCARTLF